MKIAGQERELKYGVNSIRALQKAIGRTPAEIFSDGFDVSDFELGIHIIWAGLLWSNKKLTPDMVGNWIDAEPERYEETLTEAINTFSESFTRTLGVKPDEDEETGDDEKN